MQFALCHAGEILEVMQDCRKTFAPQNIFLGEISYGRNPHLSDATKDVIAKLCPSQSTYLIIEKVGASSYQVRNQEGQPPYSVTYHVSAHAPFNGNALHLPQPVIPTRGRGRLRRATTIEELGAGISDTMATSTPRRGSGRPRKN